MKATFFLALACCCGVANAQGSTSSNTGRDFPHPNELSYTDDQGRTVSPVHEVRRPLQGKCRKIYWLPESFFCPGGASKRER